MLAWDQLHFQRINGETQDLKGCYPKHGFFISFAKSNRQGQRPSINCHFHRANRAHQLTAVCKYKGDFRFGSNTQALNDISRDP